MNQSSISNFCINTLVPNLALTKKKLRQAKAIAKFARFFPLGLGSPSSIASLAIKLLISNWRCERSIVEELVTSVGGMIWWILTVSRCFFLSQTTNKRKMSVWERAMINEYPQDSLRDLRFTAQHLKALSIYPSFDRKSATSFHIKKWAEEKGTLHDYEWAARSFTKEVQCVTLETTASTYLYEYLHNDFYAHSYPHYPLKHAQGKKSPFTKCTEYLQNLARASSESVICAWRSKLDLFLQGLLALLVCQVDASEPPFNSGISYFRYFQSKSVS